MLFSFFKQPGCFRPPPAFKPKKFEKFFISLCFKVSYIMALADKVMISCGKVTLCHGHTL